MRDSSNTPSKKSLSVNLRGLRFSFLASTASFLVMRSLPHRSGHESVNKPNRRFSGGAYCRPLKRDRSGSREWAFSKEFSHAVAYSKEKLSVPLINEERKTPI
jgi:hypothetical protein